MGLRTRLLLLVLVPVIPALVLAVYSSLEQRRSGRLTVEKDAIRVVQSAASKQVALIENARQNLAALARFPEARSNNIPSFDSFFTRMVKIYPEYTDFGLVEANGNLVSSTFGRAGPTNMANRADVQRVRKTLDFAIGAYDSGDPMRKPSLLFGYPIFDGKGRLTRVVYAALDLNVISRAAAHADLPQGGVIHIFDSDGHVLASYPERQDWIGKSATNSPLVKAILDKAEGAAELTGLDNVSRLYAFMPVLAGRERGVFLSVGIPTSGAFAGIKASLARKLTVLGFIAIAVLLVANWYADRYILHPVQALVGATKHLAEGDLTARTGIVHSDGELNQLAQAFDEMAGSLQRQRTELNRSERALRESEERVRLVLDTALDAVITINEKGTVTSWNQEAERMFGWNRNEIIGQTIASTVLPARYREDYEQALQQFLSEPGAPAFNRRIELSALRRDGREFPVELAITPISLGDRFVFSAFVRDITERKKAEQEINALNASLEQRVVDRTRELEAANKELEAFSYSVSHDLRAPLRHIDGFINILRHDAASQLSESGQNCLNTICRSARQMDRLIEDLLAFSRMSRIEMRRSLVRTENLVAELIQEMTREAAGRKINWNVHPLPDVNADQSMLRQVWVNLLSNAVKYTRDRDVAEIEIRCREDGPEEFEFSVKDNGVGFNMKHAGKLFGVFERLHPKDFEGTGIGLANVQRIIARHGGRTWAEGKENAGATIYFTLPTQGHPLSRDL